MEGVNFQQICYTGLNRIRIPFEKYRALNRNLASWRPFEYLSEIFKTSIDQSKRVGEHFSSIIYLYCSRFLVGVRIQMELL